MVTSREVELVKMLAEVSQENERLRESVADWAEKARERGHWIRSHAYITG